MSEAVTPPPIPPSIPAGTPRTRPPLLTLAVLTMGAFALTSGVSIIWSDITCARGPAPCDQPLDIAIGMIVWGLVSCLTLVRGPVGLVALIALLVSPLAIGFWDPWWFLFSLVALLGLIRSSKEEVGAYYQRRTEEA